MAPVAEDELLLQRAVELKLLTKEQLGRSLAAQKKLLASGKNVSLAAIVKAAKFLTQAQFEGLRKSLDKEEAIPRLGGFEILGRIGKGGMGYVFKARQVSMDRIVALKILPPRMAGDKSFVERFHREAKAAARLNHTNIIQSIDVGEHDGHHYFAMEFVEGPTVEEILTKTGRMEENLAIDVIVQVARAIQAAEKLRIVHLDIKPSNIMITADRIAKLADFGLARRWTEGAANAGKQAIVFGTPEYISPEQALGQTDLDSRSDIYSLGATFYQMLTGEPPFKGQTPREIVDRRLTQAPMHPKHINPALSDQICQVLDKMLQRDRNYRYQNASELIEDLEFIQRSRSAQAVWPMAIMQQQVQGVQQGDVIYEEVSAIIGPTVTRAPKPLSTGGLAVGILALVVLIAMGVAVLIISQNEQMRNKVLKFLGQEPPKPRATQQGPRAIGGAPGGVSPTAPTPIAPLPALLPPSVAPEITQAKTETDKCIAETDLLVASGDLKGALAVLDKYPRQWQEQYFGQPVVKKRQEVLLAIQAKFNRDLNQANQLRMDGKLAESRAVMDGIKAYLPPTMTDEYGDYQEALRKLELKEQAAGPELEAQKAKNTEKLRAEVHDTMLGYLQREKYDDGLTKIQALKSDPKYSGVQTDLDREMKDILRARDFSTAIAEGGKNLVGKPFTVRGISGGVLKSFNDEELIVSLNDKDLPPHKLRDLKGRTLMALAEGSPSFKSKDAGEQHMMCALYLLARKQPEEAAAEFDAAKKAGIDVSRYASLVAAPKPAATTAPKKKSSKTK